MTGRPILSRETKFLGATEDRQENISPFQLPREGLASDLSSAECADHVYSRYIQTVCIPGTRYVIIAAVALAVLPASTTARASVCCIQQIAVSYHGTFVSCVYFVAYLHQ